MTDDRPRYMISIATDRARRLKRIGWKNIVILYLTGVAVFLFLWLVGELGFWESVIGVGAFALVETFFPEVIAGFGFCIPLWIFLGPLWATIAFGLSVLIAVAGLWSEKRGFADD